MNFYTESNEALKAISLHDAKVHLKENYEKGIDCPCCRQYVKLYKRKLNAGMALFLIALSKVTRAEDNNFVQREQVLKAAAGFKGMDYSVVKCWGLAETKESDDPALRTSGLWKITLKGENFVRNYTEVPSHVFLYNGNVEGFNNDYTNITDALGEKFNYDELMKAHA